MGGPVGWSPVVHAQHVNSLGYVPAVMWDGGDIVDAAVGVVVRIEAVEEHSFGALVLRMRAPSASASLRSMKLTPPPLPHTASFRRRLWWVFGLVKRTVTFTAMES